MNVSLEGFILTARSIERQGKTYIEFWFTTQNGVVKGISTAQQALFFIEQKDQAQTSRLLKQNNIEHSYKPLDLQTFEHQTVGAVYFDKNNSLYKAKTLLKQHQISCFEDDIRLTERYLMERFVYGSAVFTGKQDSQKPAVLFDIQCKPSQFVPKFKLLSIDIECSEHGELFSIGLASDTYKCVLMIGEAQIADDWIHWVADEKALLQQFVMQVSQIDPDIIIGWNVVNFDFRLLIKRATLHQVKLTLGRDNQAISWRDARNEVNQGFVSMPGRVIVDGIDALKTATYQFDSFSLENVAQTLLSKGKKTEDVDDRLAQIVHDFNHNKVKLAEYNLQDCQLVLDIFEHTKVLDFLTLRSQLTGLELDRMGGSVAAFINLYLPKLHRAGYIAPNRPQDGGLASPGGYVMSSKPGLYKNVLVLDFKSLYPSIMRTFKIDPLGLVEGLLSPEQAIEGYKGAKFSRDKHFLPEIITSLWQQRDEAKKNQDAARSQAIKILMNSFYGVLGSGGCPFYDTRLASSITMRGHDIMQTTAKWIEQAGYQVIYGDTDSTFVWLQGEHTAPQADQIGQSLVLEINQKWQANIRQQHQLDCDLEIEFETHFSQFLMPTIRGSELGSKKRYAGLKTTKDGDELVFKGLETVRSDWTQLAKGFQLTLYKMVFAGQSVEDYLLKIIDDTRSGMLDEQLVYRKRIRRRLDLYVKNVPPHVKAARLADQQNKALGKTLRYQHKGWISYVITVNGPQPIEYLSSQIDYEHYVDKQIKPIAEGILPFIHLSFEDMTSQQMGLF
ncbi:DNA polymerase II [Paraglaciecola arctica]|uniref:DNA polymerase n=1 Tax=Paraglaciecola arctica BSs20135 TaxID=493475 RepID=K6YTV8_9ALTE|nr:DNA polymerase II [Paraglaciecola arctica]GAC21607.1 DNA polymerase II [Paraglaciecola arctica BSs20135]